MSTSSESGLSIYDDNPDLELESGIVFTRLSEVVRKHYFGFLVKLLKENYATWFKKTDQMQGEKQIQDCAKLLEEKAIKSCMMVQIYRNAMVKIIANVRRSTEQCRLQHHLRIVIEKHSVKAQLQTNKSTQTDSKEFTYNESRTYLHANNDDFISPTLQRKMDIFQEKLRCDTAAMIRAKKSRPRHKLTRPHKKYRPNDLTAPISQPCSRSSDEHSEVGTLLSSTPKIIDVSSKNEVGKKDVGDEDLVARELAQLFSEETNEIDEIFGFHGNEETDDPQINSILKEIENAKLPNELKQPEKTLNRLQIEPAALEIDKIDYFEIDNEDARKKKDLRYSLWPCELYMQRRHLSKKLSCLIEEDFRWHEIMKWKFVNLFGEDSDDEFASYSPSIELDEVIICSCIKRISPWVVKHLMKPMNDGLIANRFLFKKLAKKLSRLIIMENQYPGEKMIKTVIENFFCLRQAVSSVEDLELPYSLYSDNDKLFEE